MFTSEPSLAQRIERMIDDVPIVDLYSRIDPSRPVAPNLATLVAVPALLAILRGAGYRGEPTDEGRPEVERLAEALPFLRLARNTAAGWCFHRILRDLHDFTDPELTSDNLPALIDRVASTATDPSWATFVLRKRAHLSRVITGSAATDPVPASPPAGGVDPELIGFRLDLVTLEAAGADAETIRRAVFDQLDEQLDAPIHCGCLVDPLDPANPIQDAVLRWHHMHEAPLQVRVAGAAGADNVAEALDRHSAARLCLLTGLDDPTDAVEKLAQRGAGCVVATLLGPQIAPSRLEARILDRIERLPTTKIMGFASGADTAEWTYGSYVLARRTTAAALARAVLGGYFEEDEIPPLCRAVFHASPLAWLGLEG